MNRSFVFSRRHPFRRVLITCIPGCLSLLAAGCSEPSGPARSDPGMALAEWDGAYVQRLAREVVTDSVDPTVVQLGETELTPDSVWLAEAAIDTARYDVARLRLTSEAVQRVELVWTSAQEPVVADNPGDSIPLISDGEVHEYTVSLDPASAPSWVGTTRKIGLRVADGSGGVTVESVTFGAREEHAPTRITLADETHEAVFGDVDAWPVRVPPGGVFEAHVGLEPLSRAEGNDVRASFTVSAETESGEVVRIASGSATGKPRGGGNPWRLIRGDLSGFAGEEVSLRFDVHVSQTDAGFLPYWGSPMVYSRYGKPDATPVIVISCDTARADHFSVYGYERETSPYLEKFAEDAVVFENAFTEETWTLPSHASMFTGLHPKHHGVTPQASLAESATTLAEVVSADQYLAAGFVSSRIWFLPQRGLSHGFDLWNIPRGGPPYVREIFDTLSEADEWIRMRRVPNFFLFLHNMDAHAKPTSELFRFPYGPRYSREFHFAADLGRAPQLHREGDDPLYGWGFMHNVNLGNIELSEYQHEYVVALYDDAIRYIDRGINELFETLKEFDLYERALIIVTADHGEGLHEHGIYGHDNVFDPNAHIPLIVKFPGNRFAGTRSDSLVQLADIMPTVLDVLELPVPAGLDGRSLLAVLDDAETRDFAYIQRYDARAVRSRDFKYVYWENRDVGKFFDLDADPREQMDVAAEHEEAVALFRAEKERFYQAVVPGWHVRVVSPKTSGSLRVRFDWPVDAVRFLWSDRSGDKKPFEVTPYENAVEVDWEAGFNDEIVIQADPLDVAANLSFELGAAMPLQVGVTPAVELETYEAALMPDSVPKPEGAAGPGIAIWYQPVSNTVTNMGLDPEVQSDLEALGYLGGDEESASSHEDEDEEDKEE